MAYIFLKSTTTLLLFFAIISAVRADIVLDTDGKPLLNGWQYYIRPESIGFGGGLTTASKIEHTPCHFYITKDSDETSNGKALTISSPISIVTTPVSLPVNIAFEERKSICSESMGWHVTPDKSTGQLYVTTGSSDVFDRKFTIEQVKGESRSKNVYNIRYRSKSGEVGYVGYLKVGLLGITNDTPLSVLLKKAFDSHLAF